MRHRMDDIILEAEIQVLEGLVPIEAVTYWHPRVLVSSFFGLRIKHTLKPL